MKTVINIVLAACVIGLIYVCYGSIVGPITQAANTILITVFMINMCFF